MRCSEQEVRQKLNEACQRLNMASVIVDTWIKARSKDPRNMDDEMIELLEVLKNQSSDFKGTADGIVKLLERW